MGAAIRTVSASHHFPLLDRGRKAGAAEAATDNAGQCEGRASPGNTGDTAHWWQAPWQSEETHTLEAQIPSLQFTAFSDAQRDEMTLKLRVRKIMTFYFYDLIY